MDDPLAHPNPSQLVEAVTKTFETRLVGTYVWSYRSSDEKIARLYELGKRHAWNAAIDIDWPEAIARSGFPNQTHAGDLRGYTPFEQASEERRRAYSWHRHAWIMSQFLHGEQGALLVASQLVACAPTYESKLYAASQTFDEARHVEVFSRYLELLGTRYPICGPLEALLDKILGDPRWDLKFIGMQLIIEALALATFHVIRDITTIGLLRRILDRVIRDEGRHVAFGVCYLEPFLATLTDAAREARAEFAYEACVVMRDYLVASVVHEEFGWDPEQARLHVLETSVMANFRNLLFTRIIPNLKRIGLLTDAVRPRYERLGLLIYEDLEHDDVDWG